MAPETTHQAVCPTCGTARTANGKSKTPDCLRCKLSKAAKLKRDEVNSQEAALRLDDLVADETRMPWERKHRRPAGAR